MAHIVAIRNGMTASDEKDLANLAVAFMNPVGGGVVGVNDYLVQAQGSPNNTVLINTGRSYIQTSDTTMVYSTLLNATQNVTIGSNTSGNPRIDSIVLYIDLSATPDAAADNVAKFFDVQGTPSATPSAPNNTQILAAIGAGNPYLVLTNVAVANGFVSINSGNLTDQRVTCYFTTGQIVPVPQYAKFTDQSSAPTSPASGITLLYTKAGAVFAKTSSGGIAQIGSNTIVSNGNSGSTPATDWSQGITQIYTLNQASITFTFSNPVPGEKLILILIQDGGGSKGTTLTLPASVIWPFSTQPILTTTAGNADILGFIWDGTYYRGVSQLGYPH